MIRFQFLLLIAEKQADIVAKALDVDVHAHKGNIRQCSTVIKSNTCLFYFRKLDTISLPGQQSVADNGRYSVYAIMPADDEPKTGLRLYRYFARANSAAKNNVDGKYYIRGPFTVAQIKTTYPSFYTKHFMHNGVERFPVVFSGDDPATIASYKYSPTVNDINNDVDIDLLV